MTTLQRKMKFAFTCFSLLCCLQIWAGHAEAQTCSGKPAGGTADANATGYCTSGTPTLTVTGASSGSGITHQWYSSPNGTTFSAVTGATDTSFISATLTATTYFYCITTCSNSSQSDTSDTAVVKISSSAVSNPISSVTISASNSTICAGTPVTFTANVQTSSSSSLVSLPGSLLTCTQSTNSTSSCVGTGGMWANGWTSSGKYWQYKISTLNYQDIVFSSPTSSSSTGPHTRAVYYSTDGTNFTHIQTNSWSGSGCTSTGNISLPAAANNQANLYVRLIMTGASSSSGTNRVSPNAFKGKALTPAINPSYQWKKNGNNVGTNSATYIDNTLADNDVITVVVNPGMCASPATKTSNTVTMTVNPSVTPSASVSATDTTICGSTPVTFTVLPTNGGTTPSYQWKLNGVNVGSNSTTYSSSTLNDNDKVTCIMTSNAACALPANASGDTITMVVNPAVTPSLSVSSTDTTICNGTPVTFTAAPANGGSAPAYQWKLNGTNVGTNSTSYINNALSDNDEITCMLTSNANCATSSTAEGDTITMVVNPVVTPSVSITASASTICAGTAVTFTASATNGGATPQYQWRLNGVNTGTNSTTFSSSTLSNNDVITCILTNNEPCVTKAKDTSNAITMTVNAVVTPSVIAAASNVNICAGTAVTFTATPSNGGTIPSYQWRVNGVNVGTNNITYSSSSLNNNDVINCIMTSNAVCATKTKDTSNNVAMTVNPVLTPSVSVTANNTTICAGETVNFTATPANGGSTPAYQWRLNGTNVGTNSTTYTSSSLNNNDIITCILTSNANCISKAKDTSNAVTMTVNPVLVPSISITTPNTTICSGTSVTFTSTPTNGGIAPTYQWKKNNVNVGINSSNYIDNALATGDVITVELTGNGMCVDPTPVNSNSLTMTVDPTINASINITVTPGTSVCAGSPVTFNATPLNGGTNPAYEWKVNGITTGSNAPSLTNSSLATGDVVTCELTSSATCATPPVSTSNGITVTVMPVVVPSVTVTANPGTHINSGQTVTFTANITNGGALPAIQWMKNNVAIPTATATSFTTDQLTNDDTITCEVTSQDPCAMPNKATSNQLVMNVSTGIIMAANDIANAIVYPNPNNGSFVIEASISNAKEAKIEVMNVVGQQVYQSVIPVNNGKIKQAIQLGSADVKGSYLLRLHTDAGTAILRFITQ